MNRSIRHTFLAATTACGLWLAPATAQTTATTDPVGAVSVTLNGASDNYMTIPLLREDVFVGTVEAVSSNSVTLGGSPEFSPGRFVSGDPANPQPANSYMLYIVSGSRSGSYFPIVSNSATSVTVDTSLSGLDGVSGSDVEILPFWTISEAFPGEGLPENTQILLYDRASSGSFKAPTIYTYFDGFGWYDGQFNLVDDNIIYPGEGFVVRTPSGSADSAVTFSGSVLMNPLSEKLRTSASEVSDFYLGVPSPVDSTLADSGLAIVDQVQIFVYHPSQTGYFNAPTIYTYFDGFGWYDGQFNLVDQVKLRASTGIVLRIPKQPSEPSWNYSPPY